MKNDIFFFSGDLLFCKLICHLGLSWRRYNKWSNKRKINFKWNIYWLGRTDMPIFHLYVLQNIKVKIKAGYLYSNFCVHIFCFNSFLIFTTGWAEACWFYFYFYCLVVCLLEGTNAKNNKLKLWEIIHLFAVVWYHFPKLPFKEIFFDLSLVGWTMTVLAGCMLWYALSLITSVS